MAKHLKAEHFQGTYACKLCSIYEDNSCSFLHQLVDHCQGFHVSFHAYSVRSHFEKYIIALQKSDEFYMVKCPVGNCTEEFDLKASEEETMKIHIRRCLEDASR